MVSIDQLVTQLQSGAISRRAFMQGATALGVSAGAAGMLAQSTSAQDATPDAESVEATTSITRAEYREMLQEYFEFEEAESEGGQVIYTETSDIVTLNPQLSNDIYSNLFTRLMFQYLTTTSPIDSSPAPNLADYWELADDGMTYTFHLPPDARWHDGEPLTADDVVFSIDAIFDESSLSPRRATVMAALDTYRAIDDHTVELVSIDQLASFFEDATNNVAIMPRHIWEDIPFAEWGSAPGATGQDPDQVVASGPMRFVEWAQNDHATIIKDPDYWRPDEAFHIDEFVYQYVGEESTAINALQTGESDIVPINFPQVEQLRTSNPELQIVDYDSFTMFHYYMNLDESHTSLFLDERVRKALLYALDRDLLVESVYDGFATRADGSQPVLSPAYAPDRMTTIYTYEPEFARELLAEAGWEDRDGDGVVENEDGDRMSFELMYSEGTPVFEVMIPYLQQAWGEVGIEMIPSSMPFPTLNEFALAGDFHMALGSFGWGSNPDQGRMFRTDAADGAGFNFMSYSNEEYDELNDEQRRELDEEARIDLLIEQTDILNEDQPNGVLVFGQQIMGGSPRLRNFMPNAHGLTWTIGYLWVDE